MKTLLITFTLFCACRNDMYDAPKASRSFVFKTPKTSVVFSYASKRHAPLLNLEILQRGHARFEIYCSPCHGPLGEGNGTVVQHGFTVPPDLHSASVSVLSETQIMEIILDGIGAMPSYAKQLSKDDALAIASFVKAMQFSRRVPAHLLSNSDRLALGEGR